ncbi:hypothetical protein [Demequina silvatica]|uniref:hypothetical protein n=1 Tax=Demequina silvatica TaxID=1638988 RepID=UPI000A5E93F2|nr:hypothetical protein [Demequina silvatica]
MGEWRAEDSGDGAFERFYRKLPEYEQAVLAAAIEHVLERLGPDICRTEWGKALGSGLYEFRVRRSLHAIVAADSHMAAASAMPDRQVLLRVFCTFRGDRIVLLLGGYNKGRDPSAKRQQREIRAARRRLAASRH